MIVTYIVFIIYELWQFLCKKSAKIRILMTVLPSMP